MGRKLLKSPYIGLSNLIMGQPMVREHLESSAMTGACRKWNMFKKDKRDPAYSGSFYWFRNCFVFSRESYQE